MRHWWLLVALLVGLATPAHAKRIACQRSLSTGAGERIAADTIPQVVPTIRAVHVEPDALWIDGDFPPGLTRVRIQYWYRDLPIELWTTPDRRYVCTDNHPVPMGAEVVVTAVDAQGNAASTKVYAHGHHVRCGMGAMMLVMFGIPIVLIGLAILLFLRSLFRRHKLKRIQGVELTPLAAESVLRATIADLWAMVAIGLALAAALYFTGDEPYAFAVAWFPLTRFGRLVLTRRFLKDLDQGLPMALHDNLLATVGSYIVVTRSVARTAQLDIVPTAINRKR